MLLVLGLVLVFMAPLFHFYALPRVEKVPYDIYDRSVSLGTGRYFDAKTLSMTNARPLENITITKGIPSASNHRVAVMSQFQRTTDLQSGIDINYSQDVYSFDRSTGYAVHCCGESPRHEGITLKFPFDVSRSTTYPFYDITARNAFPATYARSEEVAGLKTYVFVSHIPDTVIGTIDQFPGFLAGKPREPAVTVTEHYMADTTVWVEPTTGAIVKGAQRSTEWGTDAGGRFVTALSDTDFTYSQPDVERTAARIKGKAFLLKLVRTVVPYYAPLAGILLAVAALALLGTVQGRAAVSEAVPAMAETSS